MTVTNQECAKEILETVPLIMKDIRSQMRSRRTNDLTVPQFRTLNFVNRNAGASLTQVAEHIGITLPSMSKLADDLLHKGLLKREEHPTDRRRIKLQTTPLGVKITETAREGTMKYLSQKLEGVNSEDCKAILEAMEKLRSVFRTNQ
ncbi:MAG: MarR family transcriptional regulator [Candidatus Bathyarchaeota archaeon]|nr:MarR family transcriptional regulator [Candidatus Bathyarchaeota archaeon]